MYKLMKQFIVVALAAALIVGEVLAGIPGIGGLLNVRASAKTIGDYNQGDHLKFGRYPQTEIKDTDLVAVLDAQPQIWYSYGYYVGTGNWKNGKMAPSDYMEYTDVEYGGQKYRGVRFSQYRPEQTAFLSTINQQVANGYNQLNHTYWFRWEPIWWRVLDPSTGLMLSETIIDSQPVNNYMFWSGNDENAVPIFWGGADRKYYANNYAESFIHEWLTEESDKTSFLNTAFTKAQRDCILATTLDNSAHDSKYDSVSTTDKVFLLSYSDVLNPSYGLFSSSGNRDARTSGTDYARCQGLHEIIFFLAGDKYSAWWLRTAGLSSYSSGCVAKDISKISSNHTNVTYNGIRPALRLDPTVEILPSEGNDPFEFGCYPQTEVKDTELIAELNTQPQAWHSYGYYSGTFIGIGTRENGKMTPSDYMEYTDVEHGGQKYRGVRFSQYRPEQTADTPSASYSYQDDNGYNQLNHTYWFRWEPLQWRILNPYTGLMLCETIIDSQPYNNYALYSTTDRDPRNYPVHWGDTAKTHYASNYAKSSLRNWLTEESDKTSFLNTAFTKAQRDGILATTLDNSAVRTAGPVGYDSASTTDKVYLLSLQDVQNPAYVFNGSTSYKDPERQAKGSDYAKCQGLHVQSLNEYSYWWLRTSDNSTDLVCCVNYNGETYPASLITCKTYVGIRPALRLDPASEILQSEGIDPFNAHTYMAQTVKPTCETKGHTVYFCAYCDDSYVTDETPALGHAWDAGKVTKPAKCTEEGVKMITCIHDSGHTRTEPIAATGHSFSEWIQIKSPTLDAEGEEMRTCTECGAAETRSIPKLPMPKVVIQNFAVSSKAYDYRSTITFKATVEKPLSGGQIHWFVDGKDVRTGDSYTAENVKQGFSLQAKYFVHGQEIPEAATETEKVNVNAGFFARLKAFFRALFGKLPKLVQTYLGARIADRPQP